MVLVLATSSRDTAWRDFARLPAALPCSAGQYVVLTFTADNVFIESYPFNLNADAHDTALDHAGGLYLIGNVGSTDLPTVHAIQPNLNGYGDAFVAKIDMNAAPGRAIWPPPFDGTYANQPFRSLWERTDMPVSNGLMRRSWVWGPEPITAGFRERNSDSPDGLHMVQYFDKSRMEVNNLNAPRDPWYVTNGLLVEEMIVGAVQVGTQSVEPRGPSEEAVAGDPAADNPNAPTYRSFRDWSFPLNKDRTSDRRGQAVTTVLSKDGRLSDSPELVRHAATIGYYEPQIGHTFPRCSPTSSPSAAWCSRINSTPPGQSSRTGSMSSGCH
jgi:hypothetical protein